MAEPRAARSTVRVMESWLLRVLPPASRYLLRGPRESLAQAGAALGVPLSLVACRAAVRDGRAALWLGPDEHLLLDPASAAGAIPDILAHALRELPHSLVDVSHRQVALQVSGPSAAAALNSGCPLDLDESAFPVHMCTRTVLNKAEIVLWRTASDIFHIEAGRSFAPYVALLLAQAARELATPA